MNKRFYNDILERPDGRTIKNHFIANYQRQDLNKVETVTIDMNAVYVSVIKEIFPQAKIIINRFHLVQLISRTMNMMRVRIMNTFRTSNGEDMKKYRRLKRYWRLLLKYKHDLSHTEYKYYRMVGQRLEVNLVQELLDYNDTLKANYDLYQILLECIKEKDFKQLSHRLANINTNMMSRYMRTSIRH